VSVPIGTILSVYAGPLDGPRREDYLYCDGRIISRDEHLALFGYLAVANPSLVLPNGQQCYLPDLRGQFLRGFMYGPPSDFTRTDQRLQRELEREARRRVGDYQPDEFNSHSHSIRGTGGERVGIAVTWGTHSGERDGNPIASMGGTTPWDTSIAGGAADETRPKNIVVSFFIKRTKNGEEPSLRVLFEQRAPHLPEHVRESVASVMAAVDALPNGQ